MYYYFAENRFKFLVEWTWRCTASFRFIQRFFHSRIPTGIRVWEKGIHLLFRKDNYGEIPFEIACKKFGDEQVMNIIEDTLARYSDTPLNIVEALITAAIDENIHLDCVYFLLRREPDILQKLLSTVAMMDSNNMDNEINDGSNDENDNLRRTKTNPKKRQRNENVNDDDDDDDDDDDYWI